MNRKFNPFMVFIAVLAAVSLFVGAAAAQDATLVPTMSGQEQPTAAAPTAQPTAAGEQQGQTTTGAQPGAQGDIVCDADLMLNLYIADRFFHFSEFQNRLVERGADPSTLVDLNRFNRGQYAPLFESFGATQAAPAGQGAIGIFSEQDVNSILDTMMMDDMTGQPAVTLLNPASVAGEPAECAQLRTQLNNFYTALALQDLSTGMALSSGTQTGAVTTAQPGAQVVPTQAVAATAAPVTAATPLVLDTVLDDPAAFYGQAMTVEGNLSQLVNERMLVISDDDLIGPDELLVLNTADGPFDPAMQEGSRVQVTGTLHQFVLADVEHEFGIELDDNQFAGWEGRPVLVADANTLVHP